MPLRIAIAGAGIGGLMTAISLFHHLPTHLHSHVQLDIYERSATLREVGAGVGIWPRVWTIIEALGLSEDLSRVQGEGSELDIRYRRSGEFLFASDSKEWVGGGAKPFHRVDFYSVLLARMPQEHCKFHLKKKFVAYHKTASGVSLEFDDSTLAECDILIGSDGVGSKVRRSMLNGGPGSVPLYSGHSAYRAVIDADKVPAHHYTQKEMSMSLNNQGTLMLLTYPVLHEGKKVINTGVAIIDIKNAGIPYEGPLGAPQTSTEEMREKLQVVPDSELESVLDAIKNPTRWTICTVGPLESFIEGNDTPRVCLLGDAAHAMDPTLASGAGSAIEDAYVLTYLLARAVDSPSDKIETNVTSALRIYDQVRRPLATEVQRQSRALLRIYALVDNPEDTSAEGLKQRIKEVWKWSKRDLPTEQLQIAGKLFGEASSA